MTKNDDFPYAELAVSSNFSFLRGASHPEELVEMAHLQGYHALAIADRNSLAGVVRAHVKARELGLQLIIGARLVLEGGLEILAFPKDRAAYGRLSKLLTLGNRRAAKGDCHLSLSDLDRLEGGVVLIAMPPRDVGPDFAAMLENFPRLPGGRAYLAAQRLYHGHDARRLAQLQDLALRHDLPLIATNDVYYHTPRRRPLQDVLTCIRHHVTIDAAGLLLEGNAERYLKHPSEIYRRFRGYEAAVKRTLEVAAFCTFSLDELAYEYPDEPGGESATPQEELERLTWAGAAARYPDGVSDKIRALLNHEIALIKQLDYAPYFLTVHDLVRFARSRGILCQGRGSAANSAVCYCLGITSVDPVYFDLLFERFISAERDEPPDIDVDFEHERREEVIQYIYQKYGRHRAGIAATVICYRVKMAVREVGKVMGLSADIIAALGTIGWDWSVKVPNAEHMEQTGLDFTDPRLRQCLILAGDLLGFPRHLSQHVGGFVITRGPLEELCPIANAAMADRTFVEWDKDDLAALKILKIDVLALGMLSCIRKAFDLLETHYDRRLDLATIPQGDTETYDMICRADTVGVFQIESRAQMTMLPRLRPRTFYDLVIEVAIVRPGPIQGDMVHPYLRRRQGLEEVTFPSQELEDILGKTLGVPLFQEQAMNIAITAAGFTPGEADRLRRAMATFKRTGTIGNFKEKFITGMLAKDYKQDFAERCFKQIEGFSDYGFPESHATSFALLAYVSSWLKCHYPDAFTCALLNSLPMGFYSSSSLVRDFRDHGGTVLPPDINHSDWDHHLVQTSNRQSLTGTGGGAYALRLGFRQVKGLKRRDMAHLVAARQGGYDSVRDCYFRSGLSVGKLELLAHADGFSSLGLGRRQALWLIQGLETSVVAQAGAADSLPLFAAVEGDGDRTELQREAEVALPRLRLGESVMEDYATLKLSLKAHPVAFLRQRLKRNGFVPHGDLPQVKAGRKVKIAGLVLVRQRPGTASGVVFLTLEDETGIANAIVWPMVFEKYRKLLLTSRLIGVLGKLEREQSVTHIVVDKLVSLDAALYEKTYGADEDSTPPQAPPDSALPKGRNFC
ncbi:error-prone DNA polymerase [Paremcibacter congregatus]|uniref:Error-prone DNA polymerase n=1 Tax=Paremcibacter congregatus TaxID=2043170 RepID=A0A2G4YNP0_9PROT|nr:error-prone DNA polymerase [Paremcibacter congregatus]PHZ83930.1 error-prone DNA polymerase [Paremcibacter congregatus]QDE28970.1 error-prone DNA polymerase [Paremcibacter congregatus]